MLIPLHSLDHEKLSLSLYSQMRKRSNGEPGEVDLVDSVDAPVENGDAPVMHCKPISIPVVSNTEEQTPGDRTGGMMIGYAGRFRIQPDLIGLAIGYRGATIQEARGLPGVRTVDLLQDGIVHVEAEVGFLYYDFLSFLTQSNNHLSSPSKNRPWKPVRLCATFWISPKQKFPSPHA